MVSATIEHPFSIHWASIARPWQVRKTSETERRGDNGGKKSQRALHQLTK